MRNLLLTIRFVGTNYCGYQFQANAISVAERFQDAIEAIFGQRLPTIGCSRTDALVHANMFCISLKTESTIRCDNIIKALNTNLPYDIAVTGCKEVPLVFHARYDCTGKEYLYKIYNGTTRDPFYYNFAYHYRRPLNVDVLNSAAKGIIGTYDFAAFCSAGSKVTDTVRTVFGCDAYREGDLITIRVNGNGFLYNMVRIIAGTLLMADEKGLLAADIKDIIVSKNRIMAGITAPPCGLYLNRVFYDEKDTTIESNIT